MTCHPDVLRRFVAGWTARQEPGVTPERRGPFTPPAGYGLTAKTIAYTTLRALVAVGHLRARTVDNVTTWRISDEGRAYVAQLDARKTAPRTSRVSGGTGGWAMGKRRGDLPLAWDAGARRT